MAWSRSLASGIVAVALAASIGSASAQYYYPAPPPPPPFGYAPPPPDYYPPRPRYPYEPPPPRYRPQAQLSNHCWTKRIQCEIPAAPVGSACRCFVPGFGPDGGAVIQ